MVKLLEQMSHVDLPYPINENYQSDEKMSLLEDIINELIDNKAPLSAALLKTKVLASRTENHTLLQWVNYELSGYSNYKDLPKYRIAQCHIYGSYINGHHQFNGQVFPTMIIPRDYRIAFNEMPFYGSVQALEQLIDETSNGTVSSPLTPEHLSLLEHYLKKENPFFSILSASKRVGTNFLSQILANVRSLLLDFMLEIEKTFGSEVDIKTLKEQSHQILNIMNQTITNSGDGNVINTGADAKLNSKVKVIKSDLQTLRLALEEMNIADAEIRELIRVIDTEKPDEGGKFGPKVQTWISKMLAKSLDGSWEVGIAIAGGVLTEILKNYYNF